MTSSFFYKNYKKFFSVANKTYVSLYAVLLSACGGSNGSTNKITEVNEIGFSPNYVPPPPTFNSPTKIDPSFKALEPTLIAPYWIASLEMYDGMNVINQNLSKSDRSIKFSFPLSAPDYLPVSIVGWAPANEELIYASKQIFSKLDEVLNISIFESEDTGGFNNFAISKSIQSNSAGFSYFPNNNYQLGSDIFISKNFSSPLILSSGYTNYDYEILLHEIGHALGLKHPFEGDGGNLSILTPYEDHTKFTAMSYNDRPLTFNGTFRSLDWMTLTKFYGVNPEFRSGNDVYTFNDFTGTFIIDGNGIDTISEASATADIFIDLRPGTQNYEGYKSRFITDSNQLTISHGSDIENVYTGNGQDVIVGNHLANIINAGDGDDIIFAGEAADFIYPGSGYDKIDLSEDVSARDTIVIEKIYDEGHYDTVYGFTQGVLGDVIDLQELDMASLTVLPIVDAVDVPSGYIDNCLVRVFGAALNDTEMLAASFRNTGRLENLKLSSGQNAILITASSQNTGEVQNIYSIQQQFGFAEVHHLTQLVGNYLDIDNWSVNNFLV